MPSSTSWWEHAAWRAVRARAVRVAGRWARLALQILVRGGQPALAPPAMAVDDDPMDEEEKEDDEEGGDDDPLD